MQRKGLEGEERERSKSEMFFRFEDREFMAVVLEVVVKGNWELGIGF